MQSDRFSSASPLKTPVAFMIYHRPDTTKQVFSEIARVKPPVLMVVADGPRADHPQDDEDCSAARKVIEQVNWPCKVLTNYAETNMGLRRRVSSGLNWVFSQVEEAVILEDDCLPNYTFFRFCEELLERYRNLDQVMHIGGDNFLSGRVSFEGSYYFSRYPHILGWASWRRAWQHYDVDLKLWSSSPNRNVYLRPFRTRNEKKFWTRTWNALCQGKIDTWDYQWVFACIARNGLAVVPEVNLVQNIGFGPSATHTKEKARLPSPSAEALQFPLRHPDSFLWFDEADDLTRKLFFHQRSLPARAVNKVLKALRPAN
jgi:hypothetical protein